MSKEVGWVKNRDKEIIQFKIGKEFEVEFDLLDLWLNYRDKYISICHTHYFENDPKPSQQDIKCIKAIKTLYGSEFNFVFIIVGLNGYVEVNNNYKISKVFNLTERDKIMLEISKCL